MTIPLPSPPAAASSGDGLQTRRTVSGVADPTGTCTLTLPPVDAGRRWEVTRIVVSCDAGIPQARVYVGPAGSPPSQDSLVSGTNSGAYDEADYPVGLWVLAGEQITITWTGATPGASCAANLQITEHQD